MSAGCVPKRKDRLAILTEARLKVRKALAILDEVHDPDKGKRRLEEAAALLSRALGDFYDPPPEDEEGNPGVPGLRRLMEHYFS
jgi:hypothetical protein